MAGVSRHDGTIDGTLGAAMPLWGKTVTAMRRIAIQVFVMLTALSACHASPKPQPPKPENAMTDASHPRNPYYSRTDTTRL
ncbi:MAG: hypothetical protein HGB16_02915, partial [Chlorobaculum sp.]|nr:hypothetical protein [Chlorobaculum sp.]